MRLGAIAFVIGLTAACGAIADEPRAADVPPADVAPGIDASSPSPVADGATVDPCNDGVRDGTESDIDCGGACAKCSDNRTCIVATDCRGGICESGQCRSEVAQLCTAGTHACVRLTSGLVKCWGANMRGELGLGDRTMRGGSPSTMGAALPAVDLGKGIYARAIACDGASTCAVLESGHVKCWGANAAPSGPGTNLDRGLYPEQMGDALPVLDLGTGRTVKQLAAGSDYWCALLDDATVKCWGSSYAYRTGVAEYIDRAVMGDKRPVVPLGLGRTAKAISAGNAHACAILDDGTLKCWGSNGAGQLGQITWSVEMPASQTKPVPLGSGRTVKTVAAGHGHTCAILDDDTLKCWGRNDVGQLGLADTTNRGLGGSDMGDALPAVDLGAGRKPIALGLSATGTHTCAVLDDRSLKCWGWNSHGQLGRGDTSNVGGAMGDMGDALLPIDLGTGVLVDEIGLGNRHTCIRAGKRIKCWGLNEHGQLGIGDLVDRGDASGEMGDDLPFVNVP
jgi:alpha-tubulin suppressor-like RCC1 family protein